MKYKHLYWVLLTLCACQTDKLPYQDEGKRLLERSKQLSCMEQRYEHSVDSLWDVVSTRLEQVLPDSMPADRRKNMIGIRNAGLLKQFKIFYTTLDTVSLNLISRSGTLDSLIAIKVLALHQERQTHEQAVLQFLGKVEDQSRDASKAWNQQFLRVEQEKCH